LGTPARRDRHRDRVGLATGLALAGAVAGVILALLLTQVVLPLAFRRSGWRWGVTRRRRGRR
jgi:mannose/fructose/N-acetylgalactosamine-specific phosphotransferase system component IID